MSSRWPFEPTLPGRIRGLDLDAPIPASWALVALLVAVHVWTALGEWRIGLSSAPDALLFERDLRFRVSAGGQYLPLIDQGEVWRLWTSVLLHADALHLIVNCVALLALGRILEPWVGSRRWLAWFCVGGLFASMLSYVARLMQSDGASGGAFALLGAAAVVGWEVRDRLPEADRRLMGPVLWAFIGLNLVLSLVIPSIDVIGHLGGLFVGLLLGGGIGLWRHRGVAAAEAMWILFYAGICAVGWWLG